MKQSSMGSLKLNTVLLIAAFTAMGSTAVAQTQCLSESESAAERIRRLQTTLMVGALQCRSASGLNLAGNYNAFVQRYGAVVSAYNETFKNYFQRTAGKKYQKSMDQHVTSLANSISSKAYKDPYFCLKVSELGLKILNPKGDSLEKIAATNSIISSKLPQCPSGRHVEAYNQH